ncbi:hypothetical protein ABPG77_002053, partial [Micractinium sp. CCAP 211/92]
MTMLPPGASESRAAQKAALAGVLHEKQTEAELWESCCAAWRPPNLEGELDDFELAGEPAMPAGGFANVREAARDYKKLTAISKDWPSGRRSWSRAAT